MIMGPYGTVQLEARIDNEYVGMWGEFGERDLKLRLAKRRPS